MVDVGYFLSCEEFGPRELVEQAKMAEQAGFSRLWISDHFHPWNDEQGNSPFVWSVIGALSEAVSLPVTTAVTCPTVRIHPAIIAQAAATAAVQLDGRFVLGLGTGEALNEHVLGDRWPSAGTRMEMLEESIELIRLLHRGDTVSFHGKHYTVEDARIYTLPEQPVPIYVSGFGDQATELAGRIADGFITVGADAELVSTYRDNGGGAKPVQGGVKVCWADDRANALATVRRLWPHEALGGQLAQILPRPADFHAATELVSEEQMGDAFVCGDDVDAHVKAVTAFADAGFDEVYVQQIGPEQRGFFDAWGSKVLPQLA